MVLPFVVGAVEHGDAADAEFADVGRQGRRLRADGAEEGGPACGDGGGVQEGEVEGLEGERGAAGGELGVCRGGGGWGGRRGVGGHVGETHRRLLEVPV